jgi:hypothetical protein
MLQAAFRIESRMMRAGAMWAALVAVGCSRPEPQQDTQPRADVQPQHDPQPPRDGQPPRDAQPQPDAPLRDVEATVRRFPIDSDTFVLVPDSDPDTRYLPDELPAPFRDDGTRVIFDATLEPVPPNVRLVGTPIKLLRIRPRDESRRS